MPAVTYHSALSTMQDCGDDVLEYLDNTIGIPAVPEGTSWSGLACHYLSCAVELWVSSLESELEDLEELEEEGQEEES